MNKFKMITSLWLLAGGISGLSAQQKNIPASDPGAYLFAYFTGNGPNEEQIRFALSKDGYKYEALNNNEPVVNTGEISATGGVRDPHILRANNGKMFYMVATDMQVAKYGWGPNYGMVLLKSKDMINWSSAKVIVPEVFPEFAEVNRVWAPQSIYDPQKDRYMIYWSMRFGNGPDKIYYSYANKDFTALETNPKQLFFSPDGAACIDGDIVFKDHKYHLFFKTEDRQPGIKMAVSDQLNSGYTLQNNNYLQQTKEAVEGAGTFKLNHSDTWILMYDVYKKGKYQFTKSTDLQNFTVIDDEVSMNFHPRHGTVLPISTKEAKALLKKWPSAK